jgi:16S rRNA (cytosine1402-N4)-methyltransferase
MMTGTRIHKPVLLREVLDGLEIEPGATYIDCTIGTGGHARGILERSAPDGRLLGIDIDATAIELARQQLKLYERRFELVHENFSRLLDTASRRGYTPAHGVVLDLGVSSVQLEQEERGFSFQREGPLDMRMNRDGNMTASHLVNELKESELAEILAKYGEEPKAKGIARIIVRNRPIRTTTELASLVARAARRRRRLHPATRTFLALRIAVNKELEALSDVLPQILDVLATGGRMAVVTFHSLEDRLVKAFMTQESRDCICPPEVLVCVCDHRRTLQIVTKKPLRPSSEEIEDNPRSRSAKLRVAARL